MNAMPSATAAASDLSSSAASCMTFDADYGDDAHPALLDLMHGDPELVDAFFERMFAD